MKAIIPAAGFGTRFLPLTKAQPKEMLPVVNKPTIQWVIEEAVDAGIKDIAIMHNMVIWVVKFPNKFRIRAWPNRKRKWA